MAKESTESLEQSSVGWSQLQRMVFARAPHGGGGGGGGSGTLLTPASVNFRGTSLLVVLVLIDQMVSVITAVINITNSALLTFLQVILQSRKTSNLHSTLWTNPNC